MASFCLRTKASFVPSRSPMHHNTAAVGHVGFARAANRAPRSLRQRRFERWFVSGSRAFIARTTVDQGANYISYERYRPIPVFSIEKEKDGKDNIAMYVKNVERSLRVKRTCCPLCNAKVASVFV
ncbi:hypothetical protein CAJAP_02948 [Camponotus japonicus]